MKNPTRKGSAFERKVSKMLGLWLYDDPNALVRGLASGALGTRRRTPLGRGDVVQVSHHDRPFPFVVECKHHAAAPTVSDLFAAHSLWVQAWEQVLTATPDGAHALLIYQANRRTALAALTRTSARSFFGQECDEWLHWGGSVPATILPLPTLLTPAHADAVRRVVWGR
jgi:hypothetical protein